MMSSLPAITGIGSVSPWGVLSGPIEASALEPSPITAWPVAGVRRAYLVEPFRPTDLVPGLKTRRLDRLSVWALVAASLAVKDAGLDLESVDRSRIAVVCGTGLGCIELTEAFLGSAADHGWSQTEPILFPETLGNSPASHVARWLEIHGPNVTISSQGQAGECALLQAASLLRNRQADLAIVIAGDTLTRTVYEWHETSGLLSKSGIVPGEAVTAMVLESADSTRAARTYARLRSGHLASNLEPAAAVRRVMGEWAGGKTIRCDTLDRSAETALKEVLGEGVEVRPAGDVMRGMGDTGALLRLAAGLSMAPAASLLLLTGTPSRRGFATLLVEVP